MARAAPRIATGAWSGFGLAADDPQTKLFVTLLAGVLEFQRDMLQENTKEGVAAEAGGETLGRPAALDEDQAADIVDAYAKGASVKTLARQYDIAPHTVRRMLDVVGVRDTDVPESLDGASTDVATEVLEQEPELLHTIDVPGLLAAHLKATQDAEILDALRAVRTIRAGRAARYESPPRSRSTRPC